MEKKLDGNCIRMMQAILNKSWGSSQQSSSCMATYHPSGKLPKLDEPDMRGTAAEVGTNSQVT